ncbi:MAG: hypothetical protein HY743_05090 [Deltaproteobacteria bacterium]|nr:hypothetical protein [Deltaproteobacteria bacterium]
MTYLRDPETGNVYLEADNPQAAWTPEEWTAYIAGWVAERQSIQEQLDGQPVEADETKIPDEGIRNYYNSQVREWRQSYIDRLIVLDAEIAELKEV